MLTNLFISEARSFQDTPCSFKVYLIILTFWAYSCYRWSVNSNRTLIKSGKLISHITHNEISPEEEKMRKLWVGIRRLSLERSRDALLAEIFELEKEEDRLPVGIERSRVVHQIHGNMIELKEVHRRLRQLDEKD